ncbi:hypothetical protein CSB45_15450 [candidate division KSB3 bacterium]|uniref:Uncharacterized protein n=1 Tax=candidate division KSB3 bacterium TaxID=2044937 RepID=A0A2G6E0C3_9BACT|nr:MAG: hypothetical protein CSB45_15450 [candidate division KSB3 bacterium]
MRKVSIIVVLAYVLVFPCVSGAVEIAPRISDREIVESLTELKQQQKALNQRMTDMIHSIDKRFDAIDKRFEAMDRRFESMMEWMLTLFGVVISLIFGLLGYMIWDRRAALKPIREKIADLEDNSRQVTRQLEIDNPSGALLERLVAAFRELAKTDKKVADILRAFSLL